jgi:uncharacterized membrane protein YphA (DoxX/SURF4 family)
MPIPAPTESGGHPVHQSLEHRLGQGMATIRVLLGLTFLLNGLAKLFEFHRVRIGWYVANLIDRADARFILNTEVNHNAQHRLPLIARITNHLLLPHWTPFAWGLTAVELAAGILLTLGLWSRLGALIALIPTSFLFFVYFANDRWVPEQPLELVPLIVLALVPSGRVWGIDRRVSHPAWPS